MNRTHLRAAGSLMIALLVAACGPTPEQPPSPTPTPTPSLTASPEPSPVKSAEQLAAESKVEEMNRTYWSVMTKQADPNNLYGVIRNRAGEEYVASYFRMYSTMDAHMGGRAEGERTVSIQGSDVAEDLDGRSTVEVSTCVDDRTWWFVDKDGTKIPVEPVVNPVVFTVQEFPDGWFVVGERDGAHTCEV